MGLMEILFLFLPPWGVFAATVDGGCERGNSQHEPEGFSFTFVSILANDIMTMSFYITAGQKSIGHMGRWQVGDRGKQRSHLDRLGQMKTGLGFASGWGFVLGVGTLLLLF